MKVILQQIIDMLFCLWYRLPDETIKLIIDIF